MKVPSASLFAAFAAFAALGCASSSLSVPVAPDSGSLSFEVLTEGPFAYRRDVLVDALGRMNVAYVRETEDGRRVAVERYEYKERVEPALERVEEALPATCSVWLERCPALRDEVAGLIERGAIFRGATRSGVVGPYFWCEPRSVRHELKNVGEREFVDPLDTLALFLVAGYEAAESNWGRPIARTPLVRARRHAEHVARAVALLQDTSDCLELELLSGAYGSTFRRWEAAVDAACGDLGRLATDLFEQHDPTFAE